MMKNSGMERFTITFNSTAPERCIRIEYNNQNDVSQNDAPTHVHQTKVDEATRLKMPVISQDIYSGQLM